ncbi:M23 family metallopeptidase [Altererythrobacter sp. HHU K3-1]|uniref:M23 family metallopeptidase n=1 Tax=Qipengyuania atrilutea TaxID=2744473 RepID=A0A850H9C3_9SPHN|nr:M23 family metallopeptidase [Actirhodobacter atriluteus]
MNLADRLLTIAATATITSAVWIVAGGSLIENATSESQRGSTRPSEAAPSPVANETVVLDEETGATRTVAGSLDSDTPDRPSEMDVREIMIPVLNVRRSDLTDTYEQSREGGTRLHEAIDIMAPEGTTVVAAAPGTIEKIFVSERGGNTIYVRSKDRKTIYYYAHLAEYAKGLKEGQRVRRGQRLGSVGSTGNAEKDAPHLHFQILRTTAGSEWWEPAPAINPYPVLTGT